MGSFWPLANAKTLDHSHIAGIFFWSQWWLGSTVRGFIKDEMGDDDDDSDNNNDYNNENDNAVLRDDE